MSAAATATPTNKTINFDGIRMFFTTDTEKQWLEDCQTVALIAAQSKVSREWNIDTDKANWYSGDDKIWSNLRMPVYFKLKKEL